MIGGSPKSSLAYFVQRAARFSRTEDSMRGVMGADGRTFFPALQLDKLPRTTGSVRGGLCFADSDCVALLVTIGRDGEDFHDLFIFWSWVGKYPESFAIDITVENFLRSCMRIGFIAADFLFIKQCRLGYIQLEHLRQPSCLLRALHSVHERPHPL